MSPRPSPTSGSTPAPTPSESAPASKLTPPETWRSYGCTAREASRWRAWERPDEELEERRDREEEA